MCGPGGGDEMLAAHCGQAQATHGPGSVCNPIQGAGKSFAELQVLS